MQKSFKQRMEALEALEAAHEAERGRCLEVFLFICPSDYFTLFEAEPFDAARCDALSAAYGLDLIDWEHDRVHLSGGTWPGLPRAHENTIARIELPDGYGTRIDAAPWVGCAPGSPFMCIAMDGDALHDLRQAHHDTIQTAEARFR